MATKKTPPKKTAKKRVTPHKQTKGELASERLTPSEDRFVDEFILCYFNGTQAAVRAGVAITNAASAASRWLTLPRVQKALAERLTCRRQRTAVSMDWVIEGLRSEAEYFGEGTQHNSRVRSYEILAKILGGLKDGVVVTGDAGHPVTIDHTHQHRHMHGVLTIDAKSLTVEQCRRIVEARRTGDDQVMQDTLHAIVTNEDTGAKNGPQPQDAPPE